MIQLIQRTCNTKQMGNTSHGYKRPGVRELDDVDVADEPWTTIIELAAPHARRWDVMSLRDEILSLSGESSWIHEELASPSPSGVSETFVLPTECLVQLLEEDERLAKLRFDIVPRKLSEDEFWARYCSRVSSLVRNHVERIAEAHKSRETILIEKKA